MNRTPKNSAAQFRKSAEFLRIQLRFRGQSASSEEDRLRPFVTQASLLASTTSLITQTWISYQLAAAQNAQAEHQALEIPRSELHDGLSGVGATFTSQLAAADAQHWADVAIADKEQIIGLADAFRIQDKAYGAADAKLEKLLDTAAAARASAELKADAQLEYEVAAADTTYRIEVATSNHDRTVALAGAKAQLIKVEITQAQYDTVVEAQDADRAADILAAKTTRAESIGDAHITHATSLGDALVTHATSLGDALVTAATAVGDATIGYVQDLNYVAQVN